MGLRQMQFAAYKYPQIYYYSGGSCTEHRAQGQAWECSLWSEYFLLLLDRGNCLDI